VRPGAKTGLFEKVKTAAQALSLAPLVKQPVRSGRPSSSRSARALSPVGRQTRYSASDHVLRVGVAVASGVGLWAVSPEMLGGVVPAVAAAGGALVGYVIGGPLVAGLRMLTPDPALRDTRTNEIAAPPETEIVAADARIRSVNLFERELTEWLRGHIRAEQVDVAGRCRALIKRITES
jgi:hypothetical protein